MIGTEDVTRVLYLAVDAVVDDMYEVSGGYVMSDVGWEVGEVVRTATGMGTDGSFVYLDSTEAMENVIKEDHPYADSFLLHCQHSE